MGECKAYSVLLTKWNWEWFVTLTFPAKYNYTIDGAKKLLRKWTRHLCCSEHIQVVYFYLICKAGDYIHIHLLMFNEGKNKKNKSKQYRTLSDVSMKKWEKI